MLYEKTEHFYGMLGITMQEIHDSSLAFNYQRTIDCFTGTKEDIFNVLKQYRKEIIDFIINNDKLKDDILMDFISNPDGTVRHDLEFEQEVNLEHVIQNILGDSQSLNYYEKRARIVIFSEVANLINTYGMQELYSNHDLVAKEIQFGVFFEKNRIFTHETQEDFEMRLEIGEKYGIEAMAYFMNVDLLEQRLRSLLEYSNNPDEINALNSILNTPDPPDSSTPSEILESFKKIYELYEDINRRMIVNRLNADIPDTLDSPKENTLLLLHFISDHSEPSDFEMEDHMNIAINEAIISQIEKRTGRKYDPEIDGEEQYDLNQQYMDSIQNPFNLDQRIPLKGIYYNDSLSNTTVVTKPETRLSASITNIGNLHPHLDRRIAIGFTSESVPINAIKTINMGYNNKPDRFNFKHNSVPLPEILSHIANGGTQETLLDWTKIKPAYILVVKDDKEIPEGILSKAQHFHELTGLPIKVYDSYKLEKGCEKITTPTEGLYSADDLIAFTQLQSPYNAVADIKYILQTGQDLNKGGEAK